MIRTPRRQSAIAGDSAVFHAIEEARDAIEPRRQLRLALEAVIFH